MVQSVASALACRGLFKTDGPVLLKRCVVRLVECDITLASQQPELLMGLCNLLPIIIICYPHRQGVVQGVEDRGQAGHAASPRGTCSGPAATGAAWRGSTAALKVYSSINMENTLKTVLACMCGDAILLMVSLTSASVAAMFIFVMLISR